MEDNYNNDIMSQETDYKTKLSADLDLEDKGSVFGRYKKMFFLLIGIGLVYILVFLMYRRVILYNRNPYPEPNRLEKYNNCQ